MKWFFVEIFENFDDDDDDDNNNADDDTYDFVWFVVWSL